MSLSLLNPFTHFCSPVSYRLNVEALKERFRQLQRQLHPDRFSTASPEEQEFSAGQSALVNRAYSTLLKPYSRGLYLLELNGLTIDEKDTLTDASGFLEEMWEVRESLDDAANTGDLAALLLLQTTNNANLKNISDEVAASFDSGDYTAAKECLARMKYFINIEESLKDRLDPPP
ncbi:Iron-sulfur cluster co-chaperone protein HscB [Geodia barretti]|uniref:Iron-sulfur cluster co-chaperone protein HscB n=1 Tax=Geodia barretti TaxID=519541 RepID=A0AA35TAA3_GEOBA|nr:Iron-sulfur cluster co-chaperone protein HscB [Geodia barretti]